MSVIPRQSTGDGNYYLAPNIKFAKVGLSNYVEELVYVDENGDNHYGIENVFKTELKTFGLNLYYDSGNARDRYDTMGHWRNSFVSYLDFDINPADIKDKSNFYKTPREACESGFADIKDTIYRGILSDATSVYDKNSDMCIIKRDGEDVGKFVIWDKEHKRDDIHYLTTATGDFLLFTKDKNGKYTTNQNGIEIALERDENGTYSYKDAQDILRRYDRDGKLVYIMKEGQESYIEYDESGRISKVKGAMDNVMEFSYNEDKLLSKVSTEEGMVWIDLSYNSKKMLSGYALIAKDENGTNVGLERLNFEYNDKNLLQKVESPEKRLPDGEIMPQSVSYYRYDDLNRVIMANSNANLEKYIYDKDSITKILPDGSEVKTDISFSGSKQIIKTMQDALVTSVFEYNKEGRLAELNLEEIDESNASSQNIESNALVVKKTLKLQMDYNQRGLISSQYLETSDGKKKFTNFEYKTKYNKPTKVLTDEDVTFFDFNNKGQLIKMSYLKFDKDMKLKSHTLEDIRGEEGFQEISYRYDENGLLVKTVDETTGKETNFFAMKNGKTIQANMKEHSFWDTWWSIFVSSFTKGMVNGEVYDVQDGNTKLAIISGAGGSSLKNLYWNNNNINEGYNSQHFYWEQISYSRYLRTDVFNKGNLDKLVVVGHSYGGDSAVEGATAPRLDKKVDLLITVDPVGIQYNLWYVKSRTKYWINLYADAGRQWPGVKVKWKCRWYGCRPKFYYLKSQWNSWDWIAWAGGKGTYSSYGKYVPANKRMTVRAHHNESCKMLNTMQSENSNYNFNINTNGCE